MVKLLLVESDPERIESVERRLRRSTTARFDLTLSADLEEALVALRDTVQDVVLVDLELADAVGLDVMTRLRWAAETTPVVAMGAESDERLATALIRLGAADFVARDDPRPLALATDLLCAIARHERLMSARRERSRLEHAATHDHLTGLMNRAGFFDQLGRACAYASRHDSRITVLFIDLDRLKAVNDAFGHAAGDALLQDVADRLRTRTRRSDVLARFGGDEFVMMLTGIRSAADVAAALRNITEIFQDPFYLGGEAITVTASIGISLLPEDGRTSEELLAKADVAMYRAKSAGGDGFHVYSESAPARGAERGGEGGSEGREGR